MKVLLCLCAWIASATAHGIVSYPVAPLAYHNSYISPLTTINRPLGVTYTGYSLHLGPQYFAISTIPNNVLLTGVPGVIHYLPLVPTDGKGKPDKKKPGDKSGDKSGDKPGEEKDKKEETTEESKKEESESKPDETEDLAH